MATAKRDSLNGGWKLDKTRGEPSMRRYLETMGVSELAIVAHEKGEAEVDTINVITMNDTNFKIKKTSRVNDLVEEYEIGKETLTKLTPGDKEKWTLVQSEGPTHVCVTTRMPTMNGLAEVIDIKTLVDIDGESSTMMKQLLTITNKDKDKSHLTERYYIPIDVDDAEEEEEEES